MLWNKHSIWARPRFPVIIASHVYTRGPFIKGTIESIWGTTSAYDTLGHGVKRNNLGVDTVPHGVCIQIVYGSFDPYRPPCVPRNCAAVACGTRGGGGGGTIATGACAIDELQNCISSIRDGTANMRTTVYLHHGHEKSTAYMMSNSSC